MDPNAPTPSQELPKDNSKNAFLALVSLCILAGVVGLTLWLYLQNKGGKLSQSSTKSPEPTEEKQKSDAELAAIPTLTKNEQDKLYENVVCRRFTSIEEALKTPSIACELDLSNKNMSSLPSSIAKLNNLTSIQLKGNNFTAFPNEILTLSKLMTVDLSDNNISSIDDSIITKLPQLQSVNLNGNKSIDKKTIDKFGEITPGLRNLIAHPPKSK